MEFPPYPNDEDNEIIHVYNLYVTTITPQMTSRPRVVNFSTRKKMEKHIIEIVLKCEKLDPKHKSALEFFADKYRKSEQTFTAFVQNFRAIQLENSQPLGFDLYWEDEPQVLL